MVIKYGIILENEVNDTIGLSICSSTQRYWILTYIVCIILRYGYFQFYYFKYKINT